MLKKSTLFGALLFAIAFSLPAFADEFAIEFGPSNHNPPTSLFFDYDATTGTISNPIFPTWVAGGGAIFDFNNLDTSAPGSLPACAVGPTTDAQIFNCFISPTDTHTWMISPGADFMNPGHETADLVLTITDPSGSVIFDSGSISSVGCQGGGDACGYGGSLFSGTFTVVSVPEPASAGLALAGLGLVLAISRWRARPSRVRA